MRFVANLRQETIDSFAAQSVQPAGYLLSAHRVSPAALESAATIRQLNLPLFADNGTKPLIDDTVEIFQKRAQEIRLVIKELRKKLGHIPRGSEISDELRTKSSNLAGEVVERATQISEAIDSEELLQAQLSMGPTDLIAQEDFATACLIALDLERETTGWSVSRFDTRNRRSLRLWRGIVEDPRLKDIRVYAVLSGMDYNTARSAGRLAAAEGVTHVALGIAGITRDPSAVDFFVLGTASIGLERPVPRRYIRLAQVLRGLADGMDDARGVPETFHCLGLGAPPALPIPAAALRERTLVTTDATSPIHDAVRDRIFYDPEEDGDRASTREIVERIVKGGDWPFVSPFSKAFREQFGHDPKTARESWEAQGRPLITDEVLEAPGELTSALPLFSDANPSVRPTATRTRIAHNHWVLGEICSSFPDEEGRRRLALDALNGLLAESGSLTTSRGLTGAIQVLTKGV